MNKFPVFETIKNAFTFVFKNSGAALKMTWPYALLLIALEIWVKISPSLDYQGINTNFIISCIIWIAITFLGLYVIALPSLTWQRTYLRGAHAG